MTKTNTNAVVKDKGGSSKQLFSYIRMQLALSFRSNANAKKSSRIVGWILKALILAAVLALVFLITKSVVSQTIKLDGRHTIVAIITIAQIILLIYSVGMQVSRLYKPDDLRITTVMPLSHFQRYLGEIITIYIKLAIYSLVIIWPILLIYGFGANYVFDGAQVKIMNVQFVFTSLLTAILIPLFPFAFSLVISVPFMLLGDYLKNKNIARIIIFVIIFIGILAVYGIFLRILADLYVKTETTKQVFEGIRTFLTGSDRIKNDGGLNGYYNPCSYLSELCLGKTQLRSFNWFANLGVSIGFILVFGVIGIAITKPVFTKFATQSGVLEGVAKAKEIKLNNYSPYKAIFIKELKQIIRTPAHAYFFIGVAVSMPVLTFIITDLIQKVGEATVGSTTFFGFSLLVICVIVSLIGSYSGNVISREGKQFYITKISPLSHRKQLIVKAAVNFMVSFIGLLLSIIVMGAMTINKKTGPSLSFGDVGLIFGIATFFLIGITFNGVNIELVRPKIDMLSSQTNESNIIIQIVISLIITAVISILAISVGGIYKQATLYVELGILGLMIIYALINFLIWYFTCDKKYEAIEIK